MTKVAIIETHLKQKNNRLISIVELLLYAWSIGDASAYKVSEKLITFN